MIKLDHIVIGAKDLAQGVSFVKDILGVDIPFGGVHTAMGTHNHLMRLGEDVFLEVIAINPHIRSSIVPRWYGLDDPFVRSRLEMGPSLLTWVVRTDNIKKLCDTADFCIGRPQKITRGNLSWTFGLPDDGRLLAGGLLPYVMQWGADLHPATLMADFGCRLSHLEIFHPYAEWLNQRLSSIKAQSLVRVRAVDEFKTPYMVAYIDTLSGTKVLRSIG